MKLKRRFLKSAIVTTLVAATTVSGLTGCGQTKKDVETANTTATPGAAAKETTKPEEAPVELSWYIRFDDQKDTQMVNDEVNKLIKDKINATVKINNIPGATYNDKMQVILASGEDADVIFTGAGFADYYGNVAKGAFLPLNDLLQKYGKGTYDAIPAQMWNGVKVEGDIYGVINYQIEAKEGGFFAPTELLKKYNFDLTQCKKIEDVEPLLEQIKQNEKDMIPFQYNYVDSLPDLGFDEIGSQGSPGAVGIGDKNLKVINQYELDSMKNRMELMRKWYQAGYIAKDAATNKNLSDLIKAGKLGVFWNNIKPGAAAEQKVAWGGRDLTVVKTMEGRVLPSALSATLMAISRTSKNPEKAMEFINLLNTDKDIYNMMCFGIEGKHYNKTSDNRIEMIPNSGYAPNKAWAMGNQFNAYLYGAQEDNVWDETKQLNETASKSELLGFAFNPEPVKSEIAQCQSVYDQYFMALITGTVDTAEYLPQFIGKLKEAGCDKIIAEKQKQIDEWVKTK